MRRYACKSGGGLERLGKRRVIAETGVGQHGVATATVCERFGLECVMYVGARNMEKHALNVFKMRLLGAKVLSLSSHIGAFVIARLGWRKLLIHIWQQRETPLSLEGVIEEKR
ncbi:hypothetical protein JHK87_027627 [Glycine soja]|nr:hypothetical protein JHK87_027627 [Glycine soja]